MKPRSDIYTRAPRPVSVMSPVQGFAGRNSVLGKAGR